MPRESGKRGVGSGGSGGAGAAGRPRAGSPGGPVRPPRRHQVVALCLPGVVAFDLAAPAQAFGSAHAADGTPHYAFSTCSIDGAAVWTTSGFEVGAQAGLPPPRRADPRRVPRFFGGLAP